MFLLLLFLYFSSRRAFFKTSAWFAVSGLPYYSLYQKTILLFMFESSNCSSGCLTLIRSFINVFFFLKKNNLTSLHWNSEDATPDVFSCLSLCHRKMTSLWQHVKWLMPQFKYGAINTVWTHYVILYVVHLGNHRHAACWIPLEREASFPWRSSYRSPLWIASYYKHVSHPRFSGSTILTPSPSHVAITWSVNAQP